MSRERVSRTSRGTAEGGTEVSSFVTIKRGRIAVVPHKGALSLETIEAVVGHPFGTFMAIRSTPRESVVWLCNDDALIEYQRHADDVDFARLALKETMPHPWGLSFVRPWDGSPIAGPLLICQVYRELHMPMTDAVAVRWYDALTLLGFRPEGP